MMKIAPEGHPFIAVFFVLTAVAVFVFGPRIALIPMCLMLFMVFFFRDPDRLAPGGPGFLSPADGRVLLVKQVSEDEHLKSPATKISVFMSPLDVHVNRSPCEGKVLEVKHTRGGFRAAFREDASLRNERTAMLLECGDDKILVTQVAGFLARRTVCRAAPGDTLKRGERYGMIKFSSRLDIYLPPGVSVRVKPDDRVRAGETVLAVKGAGA
jgi:phosphatidylserine decarboxylase